MIGTIYANTFISLIEVIAITRRSASIKTHRIDFVTFVVISTFWKLDVISFDSTCDIASCFINSACAFARTAVGQGTKIYCHLLLAMLGSDLDNHVLLYIGT